MTLTLLHTSEAHRATFDALRDRIAPNTELAHIVRPEWLERAQNGVGDVLRAEIAALIDSVSGPVLCTCTTLGPVAAELGAMRIDAPMMTKAASLAAKAKGDIILAYCLDSTLAPSAALLDSALEAEDYKARVHAYSLAPFWPLFEADQIEAFHAVIASGLREHIGQVPDAACIVLAQASMAGAAPLLADLSIPVLTSPETALRAALGL
ncbi:hypothetical protein OO012_16695 [Rhodobacteraceae bacterium KMM 6894]|nr:hypothetical protein [Rhodobacteraceae bacterium KMM 6894]